MLAKVVAQLLLPLNLALALWILAFLLRWRGRVRAARVAGVVGFLLLWTASTPYIAASLCRSLESRYTPVAVADSPSADAIVLLGGAIGHAYPPRISSDLTDGADRVLHAARLHLAGRAPLVVASGGSLRSDIPPEAPDLAALLEEWGVPKEAILQESASGTTRGNAEHTWRLLEPRGAKRILLVTSALHMPRAEQAFRAVGFDVIPSPTDYRVVDAPSDWTDWVPSVGALDLSTSVLHELLGRAYYGVRGWL